MIKSRRESGSPVLKRLVRLSLVERDQSQCRRHSLYECVQEVCTAADAHRSLSGLLYDVKITYALIDFPCMTSYKICVEMAPISYGSCATRTYTERQHHPWSPLCTSGYHGLSAKSENENDQKTEFPRSLSEMTDCVCARKSTSSFICIIIIFSTSSFICIIIIFFVICNYRRHHVAAFGRICSV
jgi:hypothetical protein